MAKCVLVVEDDNDTRAIFATALRARGFAVITARHGAEGVHFARRYRPDIILLDMRMPIMNGLQAMRYLRSFRETAMIPICAISAFFPDEHEQREAEQLGFDCLLQKPIDPLEVVMEIEDRIGPAV